MKRILAGVALVAAIGFVLTGPAPEAPPTKETRDQAAIPVDVLVLHATAQRDVIETFGQVQARWQVSLQSEVTGRVLDVADAALVGAVVQKGDTLATIEDTAQRLELANRTAALAAAQRALAEEQQRARIAEDNWRIAGYKEAPDPLVLRQPQLTEAQAQLDSAQLAVTRARYMLAQTRIVAPFSGAVTQRSVSPGDLLQPGSEIIQIYDTSQMEVPLPLTEAEQARLPRATGTAVRLISDQTGQQWAGQVARVGQQVDSTNRWVTVIVSVTDPNGLLPGQFLRASLDGRSYPALFAIPQSLIGRDGAIWMVDPDNHLRRVLITPVFSRGDLTFVAPEPDWPNALRLTVPNSTFLDGLAVTPVLIGETDGVSLAKSEITQ